MVAFFGFLATNLINGRNNGDVFSITDQVNAATGALNLIFKKGEDGGNEGGRFSEGRRP